MPSAPNSTAKVQGWRNIGVSRERMLAAYREAQTTNVSKPVKVQHGNVAEEQTREWLHRFLPTRFGVTSGYVISSVYSEADALLHYDVIIYDAHNSPILWVEEGHGDRQARAIPVDNVLAVLEVKAALTKKSAAEAVAKLEELRPLLRDASTSGSRGTHLPPAFWAACVFFELRTADAEHVDILPLLIPDSRLTGYCGGIVLTGEGRQPHDAGRIDIPARAQQGENNASTSLLVDHLSPVKRCAEAIDVSASIEWVDYAFNRFAFDTIARLNGTYEPDQSVLIDGRR